jgi:hypothetical protein
LEGFLTQSIAPQEEKFKLLPLELFDPCPELDPVDLIAQMASLLDGKCYASSKWAFTDSRKPELRKCEVVEYLGQED